MWLYAVAFHALIMLMPFTARAETWIGRHGLTSAEYQAEFTKNSGDGYRLTNVSGYTQGGKELYAAVWEKVSGPAWLARHGLTSEQYQQAFDDYAKQGYRLTSISGFEVGGAPRFAAIWEKKSGSPWLARHGLTAAQYQAAFDENAKKGYQLQKVCGYVVGGTEYFAAIWEKGSGDRVARHGLTAAQYQAQFDTLGKQGYSLIDVSGYNKGGVDLYTGIWAKLAGPTRYARHGVPAITYQSVFDNAYYQGYELVALQAFSSGASARFNGIWTNTHVSPADMAKIDGAINGYMADQKVGGASLAITKGGRLVFAKGYGYAVPNDGIEMSPNHGLRVWSVSKPVTSVAIMTLLKGHPDLLEKHVFGPGSVLGTRYPTPSGREALNKITVLQLLNHTSGLRTCNGEAPFHSPSGTVADAMSTLMKAADLVTQPPDTGHIYSNTNYFFLARVVEELSGTSYEAYVRANVLGPAGIGNTMYVGRADGTPKPGEAVDSPEEKVNMQLFGGFGGWVARPMDLLKLLRVVDGEPKPADILSKTVHDVMTKGSKWRDWYALGWVVSAADGLQAHNGCFSGGRAFLVEQKDGLSYAIAINGTPRDDECFWKMKDVLDGALPKVSAYPAYDLF